jgi:ABC-2 type transport system permease protein
MIAVAAPRRPGRALLRTEARLFVREPVGVLWGLLIPVLAFVVVAAIPGARHAQKSLHGQSYAEAYLPIIVVFALASLALNGLPPALATYRERGVLRRLSTTPMSPARLLGAQLTIYTAVGAACAVAIVVVARAGFGIAFPGQLAGFVLALVLGGAALFGIGVLIAAVAPSTRTANAAGAASFFPMMFFAGLWIPLAAMPATLRDIAEVTPLGAAVRALTDTTHGHGPGLPQLGVLTAWAIGAWLFAVWRFRWE